MGAGASVDQGSFENYKQTCKNKAKEASREIYSTSGVSFYEWSSVEELMNDMKDIISKFAHARGELDSVLAGKEKKLEKFKPSAGEESLDWSEIQKSDKPRYDKKLELLKKLQKEVDSEMEKLHDLKHGFWKPKSVVESSKEVKEKVDKGELKAFEEEVLQYKAKVDEREKRVAALKDALKAKEDQYKAAMLEFKLEDREFAELQSYHNKLGMPCNPFGGQQLMHEMSAVSGDLRFLQAKLLEDGTRLVELEIEICKEKVELLQACEELMASFPAIVAKVTELRECYDEASKRDKSIKEDEKNAVERNVYLDAMLEVYKTIKAAPAT